MPDTKLGKVDFLRIRAIVANKTFGRYDPRGQLFMVAEEYRKEGSLHSGTWTKNIPGLTARATEKALKKKLGLNHFSIGLWIHPSFFNHSCVPNAIFITVESFLFVLATCPVKVGDEVCLLYVPYDENFADRKETFPTRLKISMWLRMHMPEVLAAACSAVPCRNG